jgi:hypothetical protein
MRPLLRAVAALVVVLLLGVIVYAAAPAGVAAWCVRHASDGAVLLADAEGSLRDGRARVTDARGRWSVPFVWTLDAGTLWQGALTVHFGASPADPVRGTLRISRAAIFASDVDATVPAAIATLWLPPVIALDIGGEVRLTSPAFQWGDHPQGHATARWSPARVADARAQVLDFGTLSAALDAQDDRLVARITSAGGDTAATGDVRVAGARIDADVILASRTATPSPLLHAIAPFGSAQPDGATRYSYHGAWQPANR